MTTPTNQPTIREICEKFRSLEERKNSNVFYYASFRDHCIKTFPALVAEVDRLQRELKDSHKVQQFLAAPLNINADLEGYNSELELLRIQNAALQKRVEELEADRTYLNKSILNLRKQIDAARAQKGEQ